MDRKKVLELDKICRLCISERKEMRPLFSEKVPEMLMDCTSVRVQVNRKQYLPNSSRELCICFVFWA